MLTLIVVMTIIGSNLFLGFFVAARLGYGPKTFSELLTGIYGRPFQLNDEMGSRIRGTLTSGQRKLFYDSLGEDRQEPNDDQNEADNTNLNLMLTTLKAVDVAEKASVLIDEQRFVGRKEIESSQGNEDAANDESESTEEAEEDSEGESEPAFVTKEDATDLNEWILRWDQHLNQVATPDEFTWWLDFLDEWDEFLEAWKAYYGISGQLADAEARAEEILEKAAIIFEAKQKDELARLQERNKKKAIEARETKDTKKRRRQRDKNDPYKMLPPEYQAPPTLPKEIVESLKSVRQQTIASLEKLSGSVRKLRHEIDHYWLGKLEEDWTQETPDNLKFDIASGLKRFQFYDTTDEVEEGKSLWAFFVYFSNSQRIEFQIGSLASFSVSLGISQTLNSLEKTLLMDSPFFSVG